MSDERATPKFSTSGLGRRKFIKQTAFALAGTTSLAAILAACGDSTATTAPAATTAAAAATTKAASATTAAAATTAAGATTAASATTAAASATTAAAAGTVSTASGTLSVLIDDGSTTKLALDAIIAAYKTTHPNITFNVETHPGGTDGDNLVKTRLATGDMNDIFIYNSGSLLQALKPTQTLVDLSKESFISNILDVFLPTVSQNGGIFGVPFGTAFGGGILYNKPVYAKLGLSVPKTWADFEANNDKIKAAGIAPLIAAYGTSWTSQLFVLADYYNVAQIEPNFATDYTANKVKIANDTAAQAGFTYLQEAFQKQWYQADYATTTFEQGMALLADGKGAHYPMLSSVVTTLQANKPDKINDIGFFAQPGKDASKNGVTIWQPGAAYIPKTSPNAANAKEFLAFLVSSAGIDAFTSKVAPTGPYVVKGAKLPDNAIPSVKELAAYIDAGKSLSALEFYSPLKGPNLEQICVAVGSGQMTPAQAATNYDQDLSKQAKQLGLPGW